MNKQLEEFFAKQKQEKQKVRDEHLKELGLYYDLEKYELKEISEQMASFARPENIEVIDKKYYMKVCEKRLDVSDEEYERILEYCPLKEEKTAEQAEMAEEEKTAKEESKENFEVLLGKVDAIRKMMKFFTVLTIISLSISIIVCIIMLLSGM